MRSASPAADSERKFTRTPLTRRAISSWIATSCVLMARLLFLPREPADQHHARDSVQGVEHALAVDRDGLEGRHPARPPIQQEIEVLHRRDARQIALVV